MTLSWLCTEIQETRAQSFTEVSLAFVPVLLLLKGKGKHGSSRSPFLLSREEWTLITTDQLCQPRAPLIITMASSTPGGNL